MTRYVTMIRFTDLGARNIKKSTDRGLAFKKAAQKSGVTIETQLWTTGSFDGVIILSGEEKKIIRCLAQLAALGNVRTRTSKAFNAAEFKGICG